jgi:hypothetical protein
MAMGVTTAAMLSSTLDPASAAASAVQSVKKKKKTAVDGAKSSQPSSASVTLRAAGGQVWEDPTLADWDPSMCIPGVPVCVCMGSSDSHI